jgi:hypothetical protein
MHRMKVCRRPVKKSAVSRHVAVPSAQGADLCDALDLFLTGLILDRVPGDVRTGLDDWLLAAEKKAVKERGRRKAPLASAS